MTLRLAAWRGSGVRCRGCSRELVEQRGSRDVGGRRDGLSAVTSAATAAGLRSTAEAGGTVYRLAWQRRKGRSRFADVAGDGGAGGSACAGCGGRVSQLGRSRTGRSASLALVGCLAISPLRAPGRRWSRALLAVLPKHPGPTTRPPPRTRRSHFHSARRNRTACPP
jgi:hypothetical protein